MNVVYVIYCKEKGAHIPIYIFEDKDICLDNKTNNIIEKNKQSFKKIREYLGNQVKSISINIGI